MLAYSLLRSYPRAEHLPLHIGVWGAEPLFSTAYHPIFCLTLVVILGKLHGNFHKCLHSIFQSRRLNLNDKTLLFVNFVWNNSELVFLNYSELILLFHDCRISRQETQLLLCTELETDSIYAPIAFSVQEATVSESRNWHTWLWRFFCN